jgi:hypothetical protein
MCAEERAMCCETWGMKWSVPKPKKMSSSLFIVTFLCSRFHDGLKLPRWLLWATDLVKKMDFSPFCCYWMSQYITLSIAVSHVTDVYDVTGLIHGHGCRGWCLLYISRVFLLLSSLYHTIHAHGSPQLPCRNITLVGSVRYYLRRPDWV